MVCDWWISIGFVCFCVSRFVACDRNYDWRQRKTQLWRRLLNFRVSMFVKSAVKIVAFLAWGLVFVFKLSCSFTKKKTDSVFPTLCHTTFHHALITCCNVAQAGYIAECITIRIHLILVKAMWPRNSWSHGFGWLSTNGSPCLVEWKSRNITNTVVYCTTLPKTLLA